MLPFVLAVAEGEEPQPLLPEPVEILVGLVAFAALYFFLQRKAFPLFEKAFRERTERIEGGIARAEAAQAEAQRALEQYRAQLADARGEASRIRDDAREQGRQIVAEMRADAQAEAGRILERAEAQLQSERTQLVTELRGEIGRLAVDLAGRIVGESLEDEARQRRTVDRFLAQLDGQEPAGATADPGLAPTPAGRP